MLVHTFELHSEFWIFFPTKVANYIDTSLAVLLGNHYRFAARPNGFNILHHPKFYMKQFANCIMLFK